LGKQEPGTRQGLGRLREPLAMQEPKTLLDLGKLPEPGWLLEPLGVQQPAPELGWLLEPLGVQQLGELLELRRARELRKLLETEGIEEAR
jgi:hypothetical protein